MNHHGQQQQGLPALGPCCFQAVADLERAIRFDCDVGSPDLSHLPVGEPDHDRIALIEHVADQVGRAASEDDVVLQGNTLDDDPQGRGANQNAYRSE